MKVYYLGEDCPKCGTHRVLPTVKDGGIYGYCLKCGHVFEVDAEIVIRLKQEQEVLE